MPEVICIGECLIDFVSKELDRPIGECREFKKAAGGAPANVAVGLAKLGIESGLIGKVGQDDFGHFLQNTVIKYNVNRTQCRNCDIFCADATGTRSCKYSFRK